MISSILYYYCYRTNFSYSIENSYLYYFVLFNQIKKLCKLDIIRFSLKIERKCSIRGSAFRDTIEFQTKPRNHVEGMSTRLDRALVNKPETNNRTKDHR